jgi:hypothetical protein
MIGGMKKMGKEDLITEIKNSGLSKEVIDFNIKMLDEQSNINKIKRNIKPIDEKNIIKCIEYLKKEQKIISDVDFILTQKENLPLIENEILTTICSTAKSITFVVIDFITGNEVITGFKDITTETREFLSMNLNLLNKRKPKRKRITTRKQEYASCPTSLISQELTKQLRAEKIKEDKDNSIISESVKTPGGTINFSQIINDEITPNTQESEILNIYKKIGFTREELQIYLLLLNVYIQNTTKKDYGKGLKIDLLDFHRDKLKREQKLRPETIERYRTIFTNLSCKRVSIETNSATEKHYKRKGLKNITLDSNLIQVDFEIDRTGYKSPILTITPTRYTLLELQSIKQMSNYFPWEFLQLKFDESDNIFYFGLYLVRMHRINDSHIVDKKRIKNVTFAWEIDFVKLIEEALPNGKELIEEYNSLKDHKKRFILNNFEIPLGKALKIFESRNYILPQKNKRLNINYKNAFDENKIKMIFNYDNGKLIQLE